MKKACPSTCRGPSSRVHCSLVHSTHTWYQFRNFFTGVTLCVVLPFRHLDEEQAVQRDERLGRMRIDGCRQEDVALDGLLGEQIPICFTGWPVAMT